jgi:hypothetical protein
MLGINDVVANDLDLHLQTFDITAVFGNSMSDRNYKDRPFCSYAWTKVFWMPSGVLISQ